MNRLLEPTRGNRDIRLLSLLGKAPLIAWNQKIAALVEPWRKKMSLRACCERLEAKGLKSFRGRPWRPSRLSQILSEFSEIKKRGKDV